MRAEENLGFDYGKLLAWPRLTRDPGEDYGLCFEVVEQSRAGKVKKRTFDVRAQLVRGTERRHPTGVRYVHKAGWVLIGAELARCVPSDAPWLSSVA